MKKILGIIISMVVCFAGFVFTACTPNYDNLSVSPSTEKIVLAVNETQKVHFQFENVPSGFVPNIRLNNTNNLFTVISSQVEDNTVFFEIKGLKSGKTTVNALSFEGGKNCTFEVEVFEEITAFESKNNLFVVAEDGNRYVLKDQSYLSFTPASCKTPQIRYTYNDVEVAEIIAEHDALNNNTYIKLVDAQHQILTDGAGQEIRFVQGSITLSAEVLDYTTLQPMVNIAAKDVTIQIVPQISSGNLKLLRKGLDLDFATKYYDQNKIITPQETLTIITNHPTDSFLLFELECSTADVVMNIESSIFECTQISANNTAELEGYVSTYANSKFFSVQAKDVGSETIKITLSYTSYTNFGQTGYEKTYELNLIAITTPYQVNANNVQTHSSPITVFDNAPRPYEIYINVLDKVSVFSGVRVALATKTIGGDYEENNSLFEFLGISYANQGTQTQSFVVSYQEFSGNTSVYPLKITAKKKTDQEVYVLLTVIPPQIAGAEELKQNVMNAVPFELKEGIKNFSLSTEFLMQVGTNFVAKPIYLNLDEGKQIFDGFVISNLESASLSNFQFVFSSGKDVVSVSQVIEEGVLTKKLEIVPLKVGTAKLRVVAQEGFYVDLELRVLESLDSANLSLVPEEDVTSAKTDTNGNITEVQVALREEGNLTFNIIKQNALAGLYSITAQVDNIQLAEIISAQNNKISVELLGVCEENTFVTLTVIIVRQQVQNFALINLEEGQIEFAVKIYIYSPIQSVEFVQNQTIDGKNALSPIAGFSVYRQIDVGYKYATLAQAECQLRVTLFSGEVVEDVFNYYASENALSVNTSYGALVDRGGNFFINQFGTLSQTDDKLVFACDYEVAQTGSFVFAITIVDHNVTYTQSITITVKAFKALEFVGITNFQDQIYLSGTNNNFTFFTYTNPEADIQKFDVVFEESAPESANLVNISVSADDSQVYIEHNSAVSAGSGYLYFVPRTMFTEGDEFPHDRVQKVKVIYSDGNNKNYPELISSAEEFMSAITTTSNASKHYVIMSTIDLGGYTFENVKPLSGSISGGASGAKLVNVNIDISATSYGTTNIGLFPSITATGEINNLIIEGSLNVAIGNLGVNKTFNIGLVAGENLGSISNVAVYLTSANISLIDNAASNKVFVGGVVGQNAGCIVSANSTNTGKDQLIFGFDDTKINLTTLISTGAITASYQGLSTETAFGGICGLNLGTIERKAVNFAVFNNNIFTAISTLSVQGFVFSGGIAGQNGTSAARDAQILRQEVNINLTSTQATGKGGQNVGLITGQNFGNILNCKAYGEVSGFDFVGGIVGYDYARANVKNNVVQAIKNQNIQPMLKALSTNGNIGAFAGNESLNQNAYLQNQNVANCYYQIDEQNKKTPIAFGQFNGVLTSNIRGAFTETQDAVTVDSINVSNSTFAFESVLGLNKNHIAVMFFYQAQNPNQQSLINYKNLQRALPFNFGAGSYVSVVSLSPNIISVDAFGQVQIYGTGIATLQATSVLDKSKTQKLYIYVVDAFDELRVENLAGDKITSGAFVNVEAQSPASIKFAFRAKSVSVQADMGIWQDVALKNSEAPNIEISYESAQYYYTTASVYGNVIILTSTGETLGMPRVDKITITPSLVFEGTLDGEKVFASLANLASINSLLTSAKIDVVSVLGTTALTADKAEIIAQPVDEIAITVTQITDDATDTLSLTTFKMLQEFSNGGNFFNIVSQQKTTTYNAETSMIENTYSFVIKYDYKNFPQNYEGKYYLTFTAKNQKEVIVVVNLQNQSLSSISLKNFYDVGLTYSPSHTQVQNVSSGDYNLLEINLYPYYANYDYIIIKNDEANYAKNNVLLMEAMVFKAGSDEELELLSGAIYETNGIRINKSMLYASLLDESARLFVRYTTISKATVDTVAKIQISVYQNEQPVYETAVLLNIIVKDSVYFTIDNRNVANEYYLAKGLSYNLTLNTYGFTEDQAKIDITHEGKSTNAVSISKNSAGKFVLSISDNITYSAADFNTQGFSVEVTTYGENIVDGIRYQSGTSTLNLIIVDFVILQENIATFNIEQNIENFEYSTAIKGANGATVGVAVGSNYALETAFLQNQTIEFNVQNIDTTKKVEAFEKTLTKLGKWEITALNTVDAILGKFITNYEIEDNSLLTSDYVKITGKSITPLRINNFEQPNYYLSYDGSYYYQYGEAVFGVFGTTFSLSTDFVLDVYPNSTTDNPIPVNTYQELVSMQNNAHYILMNDITLPQNFVPLTAAVASFDGNGHKIILPASMELSSGENLGLFESVEENTVIKNVTVVANSSVNIILSPENTEALSFGLITGVNFGKITNCNVQGSRFAQIAVSLPNQTSQNLDNFVAALVGQNNGFITNCGVSVNISAATNVSGLVGLNNGKIASCFVKDSMIINKSSSSSRHKTAGLVIQNGSNGADNAQIIGSYVLGSTSTNTIYSVNTEKLINSMPSASGFVYTNYSLIQDCYSDIIINASSTCAGFVFENSGSVVRSYTTSTFAEAGQSAYIFVRSNQISGARLGTYQDCFYLVGGVNSSANKQELNGLTALNDSDFSNPNNFASFALSSNFNKLEGVWFYPSQDVETVFKNGENNMKFTYGRPELVSANIITYTQKVLDANATSINPTTGETIYAYIETRAPVGSTFNPLLIHSAQTFEDLIKNFSTQNINSFTYRLISDINYQTEEVYALTTHNIIFTGTLEGNGMEFSGFSIDYRAKTNCSGVFAQIGQSSTQSGVVKNLTLKPAYINLPNATCAGTLAGKLESGRLFNVSALGNFNPLASVTLVGQNAVGGVVGFASGGFKMKNITSSISVNATYNHKKSNNSFNAYQSTSNINQVSYAGGIVGLTTSVGEMYDISTQENTTIIAEVCGLLVGLVGSNVVVNSVNQELLNSHYVIPSVYGGAAFGAVYGEVAGIRLFGNPNPDFIKKADNQTVATAVGGLTGLLSGGVIKNSEVEISLVWNNAVPSIIGGVVGEMVGGKISATQFAGETISVSATNANLDVTEMIIGGIVGKVSAFLSIDNSGLNAADNTLEFISTSGDINIKLVNIYTVYVGGVVGQIIQNYNEDDTKETVVFENPTTGEKTFKYETLPRYSNTLNSVNNQMNISISNIIYGGVVNTYVGGIVGGVHTDGGKLYAGEVVIQDEKTQNVFEGKYSSSSTSTISVTVTDNKSTALVSTYYGGIIGYGFAVSKHTTVLGKYSIRNNPWGTLLLNSILQNNQTSPEYAGKWKDVEKTQRESFINTKFMNVQVLSPIITNHPATSTENAL